ncbi:P-loop containing nucleoside triphosphate hydrolase protein [Obelidium mucronatum]|nr:P-loop containing nucleoside triphosphate hydrolase protein [Obelidium mucronatum]
MEGINGTVFAYGQTASGKTYSMMGVDDQPGIIPQAIDDQTDDREYLLRVSYMEIYNETIRDLLNPTQQDLRIHEDRKRGVYVSPLKEEIVTTPKQVMKVIQRGEAARHYGTTEYNERSSRSHTIFQMTIESRDKNSGVMSSPNLSRKGTPTPGSAAPPVPGKLRGSVTISQLNLIDLAGSEKAASNLDRRKEGAFINKSLLTLGNVISRLTEDVKGNSIHIPYRDSKLTRILQSSLSGNARVSVIATVSPTIANLEETTNTFKFAERVKKVPLKARQNQVLDEKALIQKYKIEIAELRNKLMETNDLLEKERAVQDLGLERSIRLQYEEQLHESQLVRIALKERIDHLTKLILSSASVTPKAILDWNAPTMMEDKRQSVIMDGLMPHPYATGDLPSATSPPNRIPSLAARKSQRLSRQLSDKDFLHRQIAEIDKRDEKITRFESLLSTLKSSLSSSSTTSHIQTLLQNFENDSEAAVASVDEIKDEVYRLKRSKEEMEIIINEQNEKLELLEASGVIARDGSVSLGFEESPRYKEMSLMIMQLRQAVEERELVVKGLKGQVSELRGQVRELELNEFEHLEQLAAAGVLNDRSSIGSLEDLEGRMAGRMKLAEGALDLERRGREQEREESARRIAALESDIRSMRVELFSRMSISSVDDIVES